MTSTEMVQSVICCSSKTLLFRESVYFLVRSGGYTQRRQGLTTLKAGEIIAKVRFGTVPVSRRHLANRV